MVAAARLCARSLVPLVVTVGLCLFAVRAADAAQLTASWVDNSNGTATTRLERRLATSTAFGVVADVPLGHTTYVDSTVSPGTGYCYRARALTSTAVSPYTAEACATSSLDGYDLTVSVTKNGTGTGTVASTPAGINCGTICSAKYIAGTAITLTAVAASGSSFTGWSGSCSGTAPCTVSGNGAITVSATFSSSSSGSPALTFATTGDPATGVYSVEARTNTTSGVAVKFYANGVFVRQEKVAKYCLFGGGDNGALCNTGRLGTGTHTIKAQLVSLSTGALMAEASTVVSENPPVWLVLTGDPKTGPFSIEARTTKTGIHVRFEINGAIYRTERVPKFCLFGGGDNGSACNTGTLSQGTYVIRAKLLNASTGALLGEAQTSISK